MVKDLTFYRLSFTSNCIYVKFEHNFLIDLKIIFKNTENI